MSAEHLADPAQTIPGRDAQPASSPPSRGSAWKWAGGAITGLSVLAIGLYGGWLSGRQSSAPAAGGHEGHEEHAEAGHEGHDHGHAPKLTAQTLKNLGVEAGPLTPSEFTRTRDVAAVVEATPGARRHVYAPVSGTVRRLLVAPGQVVAAGAPVAEIVRDAFPRVVLSLSDAVLRPLNEDFHRSLGELRASAQSLALAREELSRVRRVLEASSGAALLPTKTEIDLGYEERKSLHALETAKSEARRHGLTDEEIAAVESGGPMPSDMPPARRILERNHLWSAEADEILALLPAETRSSPYSAAVLGELAGSHVLTKPLVALLREHPAVAAGFFDVAGLLQQGETVEGLLVLEAAGALDAVVRVLAPRDAEDWDVAEVDVRSGARVERGGEILELADLHRMRFRLTPAGPDVKALESALSSGDALTAEPLVPGSGKTYEGLRVGRIDASTTSVGSPIAIVDVANAPVMETCTVECPRARTWALREGTRYVVRIPIEHLTNRFVLPADSVIPRGPDSVVVLEENGAYRQVPVHVEYSDSRIAVVANDGAVFPGDRVLLHGAYAVALALQAAAGGAPDPHAGHHH